MLLEDVHGVSRPTGSLQPTVHGDMTSESRHPQLFRPARHQPRLALHNFRTGSIQVLHLFRKGSARVPPFLSLFLRVPRAPISQPTYNGVGQFANVLVHQRSQVPLENSKLNCNVCLIFFFAGAAFLLLLHDSLCFFFLLHFFGPCFFGGGLRFFRPSPRPFFKSKHNIKLNV